MSRSYSRWLGPPFGAIAGLYFGLQVSAKGGGAIDPWSAATAGVCGGLVIGALIIIADPAKKKEREPEWWQGDDPPPQQATSEERLIPRLMSIISLPLFIFPILGIVFPAIVLWFNRHSSGWPKILCCFSLALSILLHAFWLFVLMVVD